MKLIHPNKQGMGYGSRVLGSLVEIATKNGATQIYLNARLHAISMYERYGFRITGEPFLAESTGVSHVKMIKLIPVST